MARNIFKQQVITTFLIVVCQCAFSQLQFYNNGSSIVVLGGSIITVQGDVVNANSGSSIGLIDNHGLISLSGDWTNNSSSGALTPTVGFVDMTGANQHIKGSQPTKFNNLNLLGSGVKTLDVNTYVGGVNGILDLTTRPLDLNSNTLFVTNASTTAITRTSGYIISETAPIPGYGIIQWGIGNSSTGSYVFPFGTSSGNYIPLTLNIISPGIQSTLGGISASTYPTITSVTINNRPLPIGVTDLNNNCGTEHAPKMLDRFWVINTSNYNVNPVSDKKFTYQEKEWDPTLSSTNGITESNLQTWNYNAGWLNLASTNNSALNQQTLLNNINYGAFTLGEYKQLNMQLLNTDSILCFGETNGLIQFTTNQGYGISTYYWNGVSSPDTIRANLVAGTYTIVAEDVLGCKDTLAGIKIVEPAPILFNLTSNDYSICKNDEAILTALFSGGTKPYNVTWNTGASNLSIITPSVSQTYTLTQAQDYWFNLSDKNNCASVSNTVHINVNPLPVIDFSADQLYGCAPVNINFTNLSATTPSITNWLWDLGAGNTSSLFEPPITTYNVANAFNVSLKGTSDSGCVNTLTKTAYITVYPKPKADFYYTPTELDILNPEITFHNTSLGDDFSRIWDFGDATTNIGAQTPTHFYGDTGTYNVTLIVSSIHNCLDTLILPIKVNDLSTLYIPNAFTPDGNGLNDVFNVVGLNFYDYNIVIFNRWGEKLFESTSPGQGWDGKYNGQPCKSDVYVYKIIFKEKNGRDKKQQKILTGHLTLIL